MKVYIIVKTDQFYNFDDYYVYKTKEIAQKYLNHLGSDKFGYSIKELEFIEE